MHAFQFGVVLKYYDVLLHGLWLTIQISVVSILLGTTLGILAASARQMGGRPARLIVDSYVEIIRNTPFLVQLFIIFFGFPAIGLRVGAIGAAIIAMTINLGAYATEIVRAGIESIHRSQLEAGAALGFTRRQIYQHVVLMPALARVWPALCSQFVLMMLASSVTSAISTPELAAAAALIESQTFRSFEIYILVTLVYLALALTLRGLLAILGRWLFGRRAPRAASLTKAQALSAGGAL